MTLNGGILLNDRTQEIMANKANTDSTDHSDQSAEGGKITYELNLKLEVILSTF